MRIGFLHLGPPKHGVCRYGRLLAEEVRRCQGVEVTEAAVELSGRTRADRREISAAAQTLSNADVVHLQYDTQPMGSIWGQGTRQLGNLRAFADACRPPLVVTVHSTRPIASWRTLAKGVFGRRRKGRRRRRRRGPVAPMRSRVTRWGRLAFNLADLERVLLRAVGERAERLLVCSDEEARRVFARYPAARDHVQVIPHFVETRSLPEDRDRVRRELGLEEATVLTLSGYLHERKGHRLLIEALADLPGHTIAVFTGEASAGWSWYVDELAALARALGVHDRVRFTGYLSEADLDRYLVATDLAICPFESLAASGSLSSWIAAGRPILASDLPQIAEYNRIAPGAIAIFSPYTAAALGSSIRACLARGDADDLQPLVRLRDHLSLPQIAALHVKAYREMLGR